MLNLNTATLDTFIENTKRDIHFKTEQGKYSSAQKLAFKFNSFLSEAEMDLEESLEIYGDGIDLGLNKEDLFGMISPDKKILGNVSFIIEPEKIGKMYWKVSKEKNRLASKYSQINKEIKRLSLDVTLNLFQNNSYDPTAEFLLKQGTFVTFGTNPVMVRSFVIEESRNGKLFSFHYTSPIKKIFYKETMTDLLKKSMNVIGVMPKKDLDIDNETLFDIGKQRYMQKFVETNYL